MKPFYLLPLLVFLALTPLAGQENNPSPPDSTQPTLPADGLIRSIQPPREYQANQTREWVVIGTSVALPAALLGALLFWWMRREKPQPTPPTPYQLARTALRDCYETYDLENPKAYASNLSQAVRNFIEEAFHMPAPERTTEEFLPQVQQHPVFAGELASKLARFLTLCDLAKFARHRFGEEERSELYQVAEEVVDQAHLKLMQQSDPSSDDPANSTLLTPPTNQQAEVQSKAQTNGNR